MFLLKLTAANIHVMISYKMRYYRSANAFKLLISDYVHFWQKYITVTGRILTLVAIWVTFHCHTLIKLRIHWNYDSRFARDAKIISLRSNTRYARYVLALHYTNIPNPTLDEMFWFRIAPSVLRTRLLRKLAFLYYTVYTCFFIKIKKQPRLF